MADDNFQPLEITQPIGVDQANYAINNWNRLVHRNQELSDAMNIVQSKNDALELALELATGEILSKLPEDYNFINNDRIVTCKDFYLEIAVSIVAKRS